VVLAPQTELPRGFRGQDRSVSRPKITELTWKHFDQLIHTLAREVDKGFRPQVVVGVAHGGVFVGGALGAALAAEFYPVRISRRSRDAQPRPDPQLYGQMPKELKGKRVLIADDVAASGDTLELACLLAKKAGAREAKTVSLVARAGGYAPDFAAMTTDQFIVFPWDYEPVVEEGRFGTK
jgi:hypoxanthine phosphoribosyltransferase